MLFPDLADSIVQPVIRDVRATKDLDMEVMSASRYISTRSRRYCPLSRVLSDRAWSTKRESYSGSFPRRNEGKGGAAQPLQRNKKFLDDDAVDATPVRNERKIRRFDRSSLPLFFFSCLRSTKDQGQTNGVMLVGK